jgi:hypothetical protein
MSFQSLGQPGNTVAAYTANQPTGVVALTNKNAAAEGTVTITNSCIVATSIIFLAIYNQSGDTTANVQVAADVRSIGSGTATVHYTNLGAGNMAGTWVLHYFIVN